MVLREVFQVLKVGQKKLQRVPTAKGNQKIMKAVETLLETQSIIHDLIQAGLDFIDENPRQMKFKWEG